MIRPYSLPLYTFPPSLLAFYIYFLLVLLENDIQFSTDLKITEICLFLIYFCRTLHIATLLICREVKRMNCRNKFYIKQHFTFLPANRNSSKIFSQSARFGGNITIFVWIPSYTRIIRIRFRKISKTFLLTSLPVSGQAGILISRRWSQSRSTVRSVYTSRFGN